MAQRIQFDGHIVWLKRYGGAARRLAHRVLNVLVRWLDVGPLRSPPQRSGDEARRTEQRRLLDLLSRGVNVPKVVGEGRGVLMLSDIGRSLSSQLRQFGADNARIDALVAQAAAALAAAHRNGAYLGQAFARNITVGEDGIGFIDFEEDPGEVMPLLDAQARDWLMFAAGVAGFFAAREAVLGRLLHAELERLDPRIGQRVLHTAERLGFLERLARPFGARAQAVGAALRVLRNLALNGHSNA